MPRSGRGDFGFASGFRAIASTIPRMFGITLCSVVKSRQRKVRHITALTKAGTMGVRASNRGTNAARPHDAPAAT